MIEPPSGQDIELAEFEAMLGEHRHRLDMTPAHAIELLEQARIRRAGLTLVPPEDLLRS